MYTARFSFIMHLLFVFVSLIDETNLIEQTQANIFATNSRDVARLVLSVQQCYWTNLVVGCVSYHFDVCLCYLDSVKWFDFSENPTNGVSFVFSTSSRLFSNEKAGHNELHLHNKSINLKTIIPLMPHNPLYCKFKLTLKQFHN